MQLWEKILLYHNQGLHRYNRQELSEGTEAWNNTVNKLHFMGGYAQIYKMYIIGSYKKRKDISPYI